MADSLIAGIVLTDAGSLLTRNVDHFRRVPGLVLAPLRAQISSFKLLRTRNL
jgi:predicted nucleic acid-binding protein